MLGDRGRRIWISDQHSLHTWNVLQPELHNRPYLKEKQTKKPFESSILTQCKDQWSQVEALPTLRWQINNFLITEMIVWITSLLQLVTTILCRLIFDLVSLFRPTGKNPIQFSDFFFFLNILLCSQKKIPFTQSPYQCPKFVNGSTIIKDTNDLTGTRKDWCY